MKIKIKDFSNNKDTRFESLEGFVSIQTKNPDQEILVPFDELKKLVDGYGK